jgi:Zn-dependent protease
MKWSYRLLRVSGIDVRVHATFALVILYGAWVWGSSHGIFGALFGVLFVCALFACVALHELGHSLVAQRFGVSVREIVLLPIGGIARLGSEPQRPSHELFIAIAGPLVNVAIAVVLAGVALLTLGFAPVLDGTLVEKLVDSVLAGPSAVALLVLLLWGNVALAVFNMIPALPMDGGRVFRALLAFVMKRSRATAIAATVGQVLAAGVGAIGIFSHNPMLAVIGAFVFLGASQERLSARAHELLSTLRAADACDPRALVLAPGDILAAAAEHLVRSSQVHFAVAHGDRLVGTLSRDDILREAKSGGLERYVAGIMRRDVDEVVGDVSLEDVRSRLMENGGQPVAVVGPSGYHGLLGFEDIARVMALSSLLTIRAAQLRADRPAPYV